MLVWLRLSGRLCEWVGLSKIPAYFSKLSTPLAVSCARWAFFDIPPQAPAPSPKPPPRFHPHTLVHLYPDPRSLWNQVGKSPTLMKVNNDGRRFYTSQQPTYNQKQRFIWANSTNFLLHQNDKKLVCDFLCLADALLHLHSSSDPPHWNLALFTNNWYFNSLTCHNTNVRHLYVLMPHRVITSTNVRAKYLLRESL